MIEIITREMPFPKMDGIQVAVGIVNGSLKMKAPEKCPTVLVPIINRCFSVSPTGRPSFGDICFMLDDSKPPNAKNFVQ